ncbi:MAG: hypothetical protein KME22_12775 [Hassallia sp. WJT32-NPBG1]|nr:hypothetical protein [Hassallia sp. WJT32-NPBG1]
MPKLDISNSPVGCVVAQRNAPSTVVGALANDKRLCVYALYQFNSCG